MGEKNGVSQSVRESKNYSDTISLIKIALIKRLIRHAKQSCLNWNNWNTFPIFSIPKHHFPVPAQTPPAPHTHTHTHRVEA